MFMSFHKMVATHFAKVRTLRSDKGWVYWLVVSDIFRWSWNESFVKKLVKKLLKKMDLLKIRIVNSLKVACSFSLWQFLSLFGWWCSYRDIPQQQGAIFFLELPNIILIFIDPLPSILFLLGFWLYLFLLRRRNQ